MFEKIKNLTQKQTIAKLLLVLLGFIPAFLLMEPSIIVIWIVFVNFINPLNFKLPLLLAFLSTFLIPFLFFFNLKEESYQCVNLLFYLLLSTLIIAFIPLPKSKKSNFQL
jgi:hypothetical protein